MANAFQDKIVQYEDVPVRPFHQAAHIPVSSGCRWFTSWMMNGKIPLGSTQVAYFEGPKNNSTKTTQSPKTLYVSNKIYPSAAPFLGVYTGLKNGY